MAERKLFEFLVVEGQLKAQVAKTRADLANTFEKKRHLFERKLVTFTPAKEGTEPVVEAQSDIQSSVRGELAWIAKLWTGALDVSYGVAHGNTQARADVVLDDGTVLLTGVPATALLELEKRAAEIQELVSSAPTLDPAKGFRPAPEEGAGHYAAREVRKTRTQKVEEFVVVVPPTEQHPANVQKVVRDVSTGTIAEREWSSMITPADKSEILARCEELRRALKQALHRANASFVIGAGTVGARIFGYVLEGRV